MHLSADEFEKASIEFEDTFSHISNDVESLFKK
jgi:hypothetical protein